MTNRELFFALMEGRPVERLPFFPDISDWYKARRLPPEERPEFPTGGLIPDAHPVNSRQYDMPGEWATWTCLDFYRNHDWGLPIHIYDWCEFVPDGYDLVTTNEPGRRVSEWKTPLGSLRKVELMAEDGSLATTEYPAKTPEDLRVIEYIASHTTPVAHPEAVSAVLGEIGQMGVADIVIWRSPFGKLVQEYLGLEATAFLYHDDPKRVTEFVAFLEEFDLEVIGLAAASEARIVIISDHADEHLINPRWYRDMCIPYYRKACAVLHDAGKLVSTHLDGNLRALMPLLPETGFDLLDGCTPFPMNNYSPADLGAALGPGQFAYCGVPSTFFAQGLPDSAILESAAEIRDGLGSKLILNVGDVLPPNGDINQVVALGEWVRGIMSPGHHQERRQ